MKILLSLTFVVILLCSIVEAKVIHVPSEQPTIQSGIDAAVEGDTVLVQPGKYVENIDFKGKGIVVGSLFLTTLDTSYISQTIIEGIGGGRIVAFNHNENKTSILSGFKIQNGHVGGIFCEYSSPTITHCIISHNSVTDTTDMGQATGGGIFCEAASPIISYCTISDNTTYGYFSWGAGIYCFLGSSPEITHCIISNNSTIPYTFLPMGGGIYIRDGSSPVILNCLITNNKSYDGAGIYCYYYDSTEVINCTITGNISHDSFYPIVTINGHSSMTIANSIIYGNSGKSDVATGDSYSLIHCYDSDIGIGYSGGTNISRDPLFKSGGDYSLQAGSPCIDAGNTYFVNWNYDLNGNQRLWDGKGYGVAFVDMGAYEYGSKPVSPLYLTDKTSDFEISIFWNGNFGHLSAVNSLGDGCHFKDNGNALYAGGLIFGTKSAGYLNGDEGGWVINDFTNTEPIHTVTSTNAEEDYISETAYNDTRAVTPYGVSVSQEALSKSSDEFVILKFGFTATSSSLKDFYAGIFADWDVGGSEGYSRNLGGYDKARNLAYQYISDGKPDPNYYGIVALSGMAGARITTKNDTSSVQIRETALQRISTFQNETITDTGDYRMWIGSGPYNLTQGDTQFVYFAFVAGTDLADLQSNADAAAKKYQDMITDVNDKNVLPKQFSLSQNYPNPFNPTTTIKFSIPRTSFVSIKIYDALGREVRTLLNVEKKAGNYSVDFNASQLASGIYFYRMQAGDFVATKKLIVLK